ncbi:MAG TPA: Ig-like domain-containing protein, partial [Methanomassiliicoccales archaeon]|nr:Ig-like domain-containing protein [Methanomassiliicoccales archaeon]
SQLDGGGWTSWAGPIQVTGEGWHVLQLRSTDLAGNVEMPVTIEFGIDKTPPTLSINATDVHSTDGSFLVRWADGDSVSFASSAQVLVDGHPEAIANGTHELRLQGLSDGEHNVTVIASDSAGNSAQQSMVLTVDTSPLSPGGPYGPWLLVLLVGAAWALAVGLVVLRRRR